MAQLIEGEDCAEIKIEGKYNSTFGSSSLAYLHVGCLAETKFADMNCVVS